MKSPNDLTHTKTNTLSLLPILVMVLITITSCQRTNNSLVGSWTPKKYVLSNGESKDVDGQIFFSQDRWAVDFFLIDDDHNPINGSSEGGRYELTNDNLTFYHYYNLSDIDKGTSTELNKVLRQEGDDIPVEHCNIEIEDDSLVIYFPSGNAMIFTR